MNGISIMTDGMVCQRGGGPGETIVTKEIIAIVEAEEIELIAEINAERSIVATIEAEEIELTAEINAERSIVAEINTERSIVAIIEIFECED